MNDAPHSTSGVLWWAARPWALPRTELWARLDEVVVGSFVVVMVCVCFIAVALVDQAAAQAARLLGDPGVIAPDQLQLGVEEFGPLMVALALVARNGAGFCAEVATFVSEDTFDAHRLFRLDPLRRTLAPMGPALVVGALCLSLCGLLAWEFAALVVMAARHGVNPATFFQPNTLELRSVVICLVKSAGFGALVFLSSLRQGLHAKAGAAAIGDATTRAVVEGVVFCLGYDVIIDIVAYLFP